MAMKRRTTTKTRARKPAAKHDSYEVNDAMSTFTRAARISKDPSLMKAVHTAHADAGKAIKQHMAMGRSTRGTRYVSGR